MSFMTENMIHTSISNGLSRRAMLIAAGGLAAAAMMPRLAFANTSGAWARTEEAVLLLDGRDPIAQGVALDLPLVSENGAVVPLGIAIDRPMDEDEYVTAIHVFAPANPYPHIASFHYPDPRTPPRIDTRIRLNETQTVVVFAELNTGAVLVGEQEVRVAVSGCLTQAETYAVDSMFQTRVRVEQGSPTSVLTLITHPQETGLRPDAQGNIVPKRLIERLEARHEGELVFVADFHRSVSANPYLRFFIAPEGAGTLDLVWTEDTGETAEYSTEVTA